MNHALLTNPKTAEVRVNWTAVACFYTLACTISYALRHVPNPTAGLLPYQTIFTYGLGPIVAALLTRQLFPAVAHTVTILGDRPRRTLLVVLLLLLLGVAFGVTNKRGVEPHLFGGLVVISGLLYGFVEEMGWRGFLHDALRPLPAWARVGLTALLWCGWHFTFMPDLSAVLGPRTPTLVVVVGFVLGAWGLGNAAERTRSVLVVACLHAAMNLPWVAVPWSGLALGVLAIGWTALLWTWQKQP
ncbi:lysostaphin resistance A-like protein [Fibrella sp. WM1]|uniref:CPBP family intramembrane glutamic endopeptidase n=1 Tax=Fibrella musci TaxID=3242485 RepID=UPI0035229CAA